MDDRRFDAFTKTLSNGGSRRGVLQTLGTSALAAVAARLGLAEDAGAKKKRKNKKKKKCKGNTTKCGKKACCNANQTCVGGKCLAKEGNAGCVVDTDCRPGEVCQNGSCVPEPEPEPDCVENGDCSLGDECIAGTCVFVQGTCDATDDHCSVTEALCNPEAGNDCFCVQRFTGGAACIEAFVPGAVCGGCQNDADCAATEEGSVCVAAVAFGCPCADGQGICARICPNQ
jgi:hypothetical protein